MMSISLRRGESLSLTDEGNLRGDLRLLLSGTSSPEVWILLCQDYCVASEGDVVNLQNPRHDSGAVSLSSTAGVGEQIFGTVSIELGKLPPQYDGIFVALTIDGAETFGNLTARLVDNRDGHELCRYDLLDEGSICAAMIFVALSSEAEGWRFEAVGEGTQTAAFSELLKRKDELS